MNLCDDFNKMHGPPQDLPASPDEALSCRILLLRQSSALKAAGTGYMLPGNFSLMKSTPV